MNTFDLELKNLRKVYPGNTVAVKAFNLEVERGEFISFVGPSGCGKTTTLRMIAGLEGITSGNLHIRGKNITHVPAEKRPTSTIFQNYAIFPHMSVRENIEFGLYVRNVTGTDQAKRVDSIIEKLELGDVQHYKENSLSGGQKQRLALARGLVTEPEILLLDEPLGALDANLRKSIQEELKLLQRSLNITFVFVTHAQSEALSMSDRVVVMNAGKIEQISAPFDLYTRPKSLFVAQFIGHNIIIKGSLISVDKSIAFVETGLGTLKGKPGFKGNVAKDSDVHVVIPSELISLHKPGIRDIPGKDGVSGKITSLHPIGRLIHIRIEFNSAQIVQLETYSENIRSLQLSTGSNVELRWNSSCASIIWDG